MADTSPTAQEIEKLAAELEMPTDVAGQLRELAKELDLLAGIATRSPAPSQLEAMAELQRKIAGCLRMAALRVPREDQS